MRLAIIRHAVAQDRARFGRTGLPDAQRPITSQGRRRMVKVVRGLLTWVEDLDWVVSSPLTRARETADIVRAAYPDADFQVWSELSPDQPPRATLARLQKLPVAARVGLVSHAPLLPGLVAYLLTGEPRPFVEAKKGSVHLLELKGPIRAGAAVLLGALPPAQLRRLGAER
jgi:phosphohistidine phosphatase